jgi:NADH-quinone oxidoreductase subunit C
MSTENGATEAGAPELEVLRRRFGESLPLSVSANGDIHLEVTAEQLSDAAALLHDDPTLQFDYPADLTAWDSGEEFVLWYRLHAMARNRTAILKVKLPRDAPQVPTVTPVWPGMNWHERECFDLYGIRFLGHPDQHDDMLMRILLPEDWQGHPFRRDYEPLFSDDPLHGPQARN